VTPPGGGPPRDGPPDGLPARRDDAGFLTIWMLGLCVLLLALGGLSVDLWHVVAQRQALLGQADAAAIAGASGIDPGLARTGVLVLDPPAATSLALQSLASQPDAPSPVSSPDIIFSQNNSEITVQLTGTTSFFLLRLLAGPSITFHVSSSATVRSSS
jgi:Flp pilus assembly protein TadG